MGLFIEKFLSLAQPGICHDNVRNYILLSNLPSIICQMVAYRRSKTKENFKCLALKVVSAAYKSLSLTRGSEYSALIDLETYYFGNWSPRRGGRLRGEVVTTGGLTVS